MYRVLFVLFLVILPVLAKDYYQILGVSRDAGEKEIQRSFRKLSLKYHPDKNSGDEQAQKKFVDVNEAYEVLKDPELRQIYDIDGYEGLQRHKKGQAGGGGGSIFDLFTGGNSGRRKGPDFQMNHDVELNQLYNGGEVSFNIRRKVLCKACRGTGAKDGETHTCSKCKGQGVVMSIQELGPGFRVQMQQPCDKCGGKGKMPAHACPVCKGEKQVMEEKKLEGIIEKGMPDGYELVFERASEQHPDTIPGDVRIRLRTRAHELFTRDGNDLNMTMTISLKEALLGFSREIIHMDGRRVPISISAVTPHSYVKTIQGEGMPIHEYPSDKGNLNILFKVDFPRQLTQQQKDELRTLLQ